MKSNHEISRNPGGKGIKEKKRNRSGNKIKNRIKNRIKSKVRNILMKKLGKEMKQAPYLIKTKRVDRIVKLLNHMDNLTNDKEISKKQFAQKYFKHVGGDVKR